MAAPASRGSQSPPPCRIDGQGCGIGPSESASASVQAVAPQEVHGGRRIRPPYRLSASFLSQLETGAWAHGCAISRARHGLLQGPQLLLRSRGRRPLFRIHRGKDRRPACPSPGGRPLLLLRGLGYLVPDRQLDPYFAEFLPRRAWATPASHQHPGCEFLYILSGTLIVHHGADGPPRPHRATASTSTPRPSTLRCRARGRAPALIVTTTAGRGPPCQRHTRRCCRPADPRPAQRNDLRRTQPSQAAPAAISKAV